MITSTVLTLVIVPAVFTVFDDIERWAAPKAGKLLAEPAGGAAADGASGHATAVHASAGRVSAGRADPVA